MQVLWLWVYGLRVSFRVSGCRVEFVFLGLSLGFLAVELFRSFFGFKVHFKVLQFEGGV